MSIEPKDLTKNAPKIAMNDEQKKKLEYEQERDKQMVKGMFKFYQHPGTVMEFVYKKYKGERVQKYVMKDGGIYSIPLGVARHLNNDCWYPEHKYMLGEDGKQHQKISQRTKRCGFSSLEFSDIDGFERGGSEVIRLENMAVPV